MIDQTGQVSGQIEVSSFTPLGLMCALEDAGFVVTANETYFNPEYPGVKKEYFGDIERQPENIRVLAYMMNENEREEYELLSNGDF